MSKTRKDSPKYKKEKRIEKMDREHRREEIKHLPTYEFDEDVYEDDDDLIENDLLIDDD